MRVTVSERRAMNILFTVIVFAFVFAVLAIVAYALFEVSPFAHHVDQFRDPRTGKRRGESPRLD
ncbi:MAG: hypothetical protein AABM30_12390 [Actinomycetota bacterium]